MELNRKEQNLLLFFETCVVDQSGFIQSCHLNEEDIVIAREWTSRNYVTFGRLKLREVKRHNSHVVRLSEEAWADAHRYRRERAERNCEPIETFELCGS